MKPGNLIGATIIAIALVVAAIAFAIVSSILNDASEGSDQRLTRLQARIDAQDDRIDQLTGDVRALNSEITRLEIAIANVDRTPVAPPVADLPVGTIVADEDLLAPTDELKEIMIIAKGRYNKTVKQPRNSMMKELLGNPRQNYSTDCQAVTNSKLVDALETRRIGNFRVTMLKPALDSFERVMNRLKETDPDIYEQVGTAGALCARLIRGSTRSVSNHSWGTAIDITLEGALDRFADGGTQFGLLILAEYFNDEGWYWGAGYGREDSMHFEAGEDLIRSWVEQGLL